MKISKFVKLVKDTGRCIVADVAGDGIWLGNGHALYRATGLPRMESSEQVRTVLDVPEKAFYYNEFRKGERYTYSEDCLFLNVFTPADAKAGDRLPVLVYIHGGGFTGGCGHEKHFDCPIWPAKGVIGVTVNYRLGPLGFACLPELKQEAGCTGNYGLYDQLTALQWVKRNIAAFGGDPDNITLMGQSAGAMSVQQHVLSPLTEGLFHKAVMSSGGGVSRMLSPALPEKSYDFWHAVMAQAGCLTLKQFRELPAEDLFAAWLPMTKGQNKVLRLGEGDTRMGAVNMAKLGYTMLTNKAVGE